MKLFQMGPLVQECSTAAEFVQEFNIGKGDFVLASKSIYENYFAGLLKDAEVRFKSDYGNGEPTDKMVDALLADFRKLKCERIIAIGGGAVIDMAKILVLDTEAAAAEIYQKKNGTEKGEEVNCSADNVWCGFGGIQCQYYRNRTSGIEDGDCGGYSVCRLRSSDSGTAGKTAVSGICYQCN